jgi:hypothetical protein
MIHAGEALWSGGTYGGDSGGLIRAHSKPYLGCSLGKVALGDYIDGEQMSQSYSWVQVHG